MIKEISGNALEEAEKEALSRICDVLSIREGVQGFISVFPGKSDCVVWDIGAIHTGDQLAFSADMFHWRGFLWLYNRSRARLQEWIMRLVNAFPCSNAHGRQVPLTGGRISVLRIAPESGAIGKIETTSIETSVSVQTQVFTTSIGFDVVFNATK